MRIMTHPSLRMLIGGFLLGVMLTVAGGWGTAPEWSQVSHAQARPDARRAGPPPQHFKSGGERSAAILQTMSATLNRIEQRLVAIERAIRESE